MKKTLLKSLSAVALAAGVFVTTFTMPTTATRSGKIARTHILCPNDAINAAMPKKKAQIIIVLITRVFLVPFKRPFCIFSGSSSNFIIK